MIFFMLKPMYLWAQSTENLRQMVLKKAGITLQQKQSIFDDAEVKLGQLLFYDPILSGGKKVSCASCHHPKTGTSDGLSLGLGDGAKGIGKLRKALLDNLPEQRIPRNSPALFNLGQPEFTSFFHDGRLEKDDSRKSGIRTPLEDEMTTGFDSVLSAQAMFPVLSPDEMAGHYSENEISSAVRKGLLTGESGTWDIIAKRVSHIDEYKKRFTALIGNREIHFTDIANVIAKFIDFEWRADQSPFDEFITKNNTLSPKATAGMKLFYGKAKCVSCHTGRFQTDHQFHAIAMPQIGPGKAERFEDHHRDEGRMRVTGNLQDAYKFRTPSLRNVELTSPYGHAGTYLSLDEVIKHHLDPIKSLYTYKPKNLPLPQFDNASDWAILSNESELKKIADANELMPMRLSDNEVENLVEFLKSLTDPISKKGRLGSPKTVPSGLDVD